MRFVTRVDVADRRSQVVDVSCWLLLELEDARQVPLLTDRGWGTSGEWVHTSLTDLASVARMVIGPDGAADDLSEADMARGYWSFLARRAREQGVLVTAEGLSQLPHRVDFTPAVLERVNPQDGRGR